MSRSAESAVAACRRCRLGVALPALRSLNQRPPRIVLERCPRPCRRGRRWLALQRRRFPRLTLRPPTPWMRPMTIAANLRMRSIQLRTPYSGALRTPAEPGLSNRDRPRSVEMSRRNRASSPIAAIVVRVQFRHRRLALEPIRRTQRPAWCRRRCLRLCRRRLGSHPLIRDLCSRSLHPTCCRFPRFPTPAS